jgi:hypothetical protein
MEERKIHGKGGRTHAYFVVMVVKPN